MTLRVTAMVAVTTAAFWGGMAAYPTPQAAQGAPAGQAPYVYPTPTDADVRLVRGAIDLDVHADPDIAGQNSGQAPRGYDVFEIAQRAKQLGMRGFVIKQHYDQSAALAYVTRKTVPGLEVFGGVSLNLILGGLNPNQVYHVAEVKGGFARVVAFPTFDSESNARARSTGGVQKPGVQILANGQLVQGARDVIAAVKAAKVRDSGAELTLMTGYVTPDEALAIVREGHRVGITRMVVNHATIGTSRMTVAQMQEAAKLGAFLEFVSGTSIGPRLEIPPAQLAGIMRQVGVDHIIMGTDFGQGGRPLPADGLALFASAMRQAGLTEQELFTMMATNPAQVLGLPPAAARASR